MIIAVDARPLVTRQIGGAEQHARNIVAAWARNRPEHKFCLLFDQSAREHFDSSLLESMPENFEKIFLARFRVHRNWLVGTRMLSTLDRTLRRLKADVYHSFSPEVPRTSACPVVQTIHDLSFELDPTVRRSPQAAGVRQLARAGVLTSTRIIAVSSQTKSDIAAVYKADPDKIDVVYNGINPAFVPTQQPAIRHQLEQELKVRRPYLLAVGADIPRRNYARMFAAMQMVWKAHPEIRWTLAGRSDPQHWPVHAQAKAAGALERLQFVIAPADEQLAQLYRDATLTCCASSFEGFGLSVLESLACGTPVTCSDMRSLREVADDAAVYFPHDDPGSMGQAILGLIDDVEYRRQLKYKGVARAANFTWASAAELILETLLRAAQRD